MTREIQNYHCVSQIKDIESISPKPSAPVIKTFNDLCKTFQKLILALVQKFNEEKFDELNNYRF